MEQFIKVEEKKVSQCNYAQVCGVHPQCWCIGPLMEKQHLLYVDEDKRT